MALTRRQFLKWAGATGVGAVVFNGCNVPEEEILVQSPLRLPEDLVTGRDTFYATTYQQGTASEGLLVRVMEGRAKKVEGNPDHPLNTGKHGIRSEALLQALYHPDRIKAPLARDGRGRPFRFITWPQAMDRLARLLEEADPASVLLAMGPVRGQLATVVQRFSDAYGSRVMGFEPLDQAVLREAVRRVFSQEALPDFDLANTRYLLNFGADLLGTWVAPTHFMRGYGAFRQGAGRPRGHFVQLDPRFSMTTANADEWVYVKPGTEGLLALSLAQVIISERLGDDAAARALTAGQGARYLDRFSPNVIASDTGVPAPKIVELARAFARSRPSLAIAGGSTAAHTNGLFNLVAVYSLNYLTRSVNQPGGLLFNPTRLLSQVVGSPLKDWTQAVEEMSRGDISVLMTREANLVHGLPTGLKVADALDKVKTVVSFSSFLDETTAKADLVLPGHTPLEEWGSDTPDPGPGYVVSGLQQPVVNPFVDTVAFGDVLLATARQLGLNGQLPWENMREALRDSARELHGSNRGSVRGGAFEEFWHVLLQRGGWWDQTETSSNEAPTPPPLPQTKVQPRFSGRSDRYPFYLIPFESHAIGAGQHAHLPWLQATPDPTTTVVWQSWVEVNPQMAQRLGLRNEDLVAVESPTGRSVEVPVYVNPATAPSVVSVPFGQGHTQLSTYAANRGANPFHILDLAEEKETGSLAWAATRVRLVKTGKRFKVAKFEGTVPALQAPDDKIIQVTRQR